MVLFDTAYFKRADSSESACLATQVGSVDSKKEENVKYTKQSWVECTRPIFKLALLWLDHPCEG
jgi:hypothetical protein